ncbi:MAG TPA: hypothetical protein VGN97_16815 [Mesorhizobium sp.]|jgi:hypothetical protein|nr:hypothetical protein [Mesorhizobium sp.]
MALIYPPWVAYVTVARRLGEAEPYVLSGAMPPVIGLAAGTASGTRASRDA